MNNEFLDKWAADAWALEQPLEKLPVPQDVFVGEATEVAAFAHVYWERPPGEPSLSSAVSETGRFSAAIRHELLELIDAYQSAETLYQLAATEPIEPIGDEARELLGVFRSTLAWYFTDSSDAVGQARLDKLGRLHESAYSHDALASALFNYAALAEMYVERVKGVLGFDPVKIEEARALGRELRARSAVKDVPDTNDPRRLYELRLRIATLLYERVQMVRLAVRAVFKERPDLVRKATSDYQRGRQAEHRRRQEEEAPAESPAPAPSAPTLVVAESEEVETEAA